MILETTLHLTHTHRLELNSSQTRQGKLTGLSNKGFVNVRDDSSSGDGSLDEGVKLLVSSDGELQVTGGDTLKLQVLGGITGKL